MKRSWPLLDNGAWYQGGVGLKIGSSLYENTDFSLTSTTGTWSVTGVDADGRTILSFEPPGSSLPSGTDTQTLYYNGTTLTATSALRVNSSGFVAVGAAPNASYKFYVSTTGSGTAIHGITTSGEAGFFYSGSGTGVKGHSPSGNAVYGITSSGYAGRFEAGNAATAVVGTAWRGIAGYFQQYSTDALSANVTAPVVQVVRYLNLGSYTANSDMVSVDDQTTSSALLLNLKKQGNSVYAVTPGGRVRQAQEASAALVDGDNDIDPGNSARVFVTSTGATAHLRSIVAGQEGDILHVLSDDSFTIDNEDGGATAENRIHTPPGTGIVAFSATFLYRASRWWLVQYM